VTRTLSDRYRDLARATHGAEPLPAASAATAAAPAVAASAAAADEERAALGAEYQTRREILDAWFADENDALRAQHGGAVRMHVGINQFHTLDGNTACTPVALATIAYVLAFVRDPFDEVEVVRDGVPWDVVVRKGAKWWRSHYDAHPFDTANVECRALLLDTRLHDSQAFASGVRIVHECHGHTVTSTGLRLDTESGACTLRALLTKHMRAGVGAVVTAVCGDPYQHATEVARASAGAAAAGRELLPGAIPSAHASAQTTISVFKVCGSEGDDGMWVFDPHGGADTGRAALLVRCSTAGVAAHVVRECLPRGFFHATFVELQPEPEA